MASRRKPTKTARQGPKADRRLPPQPPKPQGRPAAPKSARKPTPKASPPAPRPAPKAPRPAPKASPPAPRPAPKAPREGPPTGGSAKAIDPLDTKPTAYFPGVYSGWTRDGGHWEGGHVCVAYSRDDRAVNAIIIGQPIKLMDFGVDDFEKNWRPAKFQGKPYPVQKAVQHLLDSYNGWTDRALKALRQLKEGKAVDLEEESIEDILAIEPTVVKSDKVRHQGRTKDERRKLRRQRRQNRLAAMTPKQRKEWQDRRNARRKARKAARLAAGKG